MCEYFDTDLAIDLVGTRFPIFELSLDSMGISEQNRRSVSKCATECVRQILAYEQHPHI